MASGSSKGFDFASDDILCSYEDYANQQTSNGAHSDSAIATNSAKEFHKNRMARTSEFHESSNQEVIITAVERSMKKYTDNLMRFLEGISSRLSQLELYCYNLDKSIGEMRSDLTRDHEQSDAKLKFLEKHLQEVHRSVQILRDKQELTDTQKELAKLQLAQKSEDRSSKASIDSKKNENSGDSRSQQLALALPSQVAPPPAAIPPPQLPAQWTPQVQPPPQPQPQPPPPYPQQWTPQVQPPQQPSPPAAAQPPQQAAQPMSQPQSHYLPQQPPYAQQWAPQVQPVSRPSSPQVYPQYPEPPTYTYGGPVRTGPPPQLPPQLPPHHQKPAFGGQEGDGYGAGGPPPHGNAYMMYDSQGGHFPQSGYSPNPAQTGGGGGGVMSRPPQMRNHPYNELIEKLVSMGYRGDHVMSVIQRLDETGQTVDFNAVLDKLNGHASGGSQRGW